MLNSENQGLRLKINSLRHVNSTTLSGGVGWGCCSQ